MLNRNGSVPSYWKPGGGWGLPGATGPYMSLESGSIQSDRGGNSKEIGAWRKASEMIGLLQMVVGLLISIGSIAVVDLGVKYALAIAGILMGVLGALGFVGAKRTSHKFLTSHLTGSFFVALLFFGSINQVERNIEVDCAFGEVFVRVFHIEKKLQQVKHDEMVSGLFIRLNEMDDLLEMVKEGAMKDFEVRSRVDDIVEKDEAVIRHRIGKLKQHAEDVLIHLRSQAENATGTAAGGTLETRKRIRDSLEQRIWGVEYALDKIGKHEEGHETLSFQDYQTLLDGLIHVAAEDGMRHRLASHKDKLEEVEAAMHRRDSGHIDDEHANSAVQDIRKIQERRESSRKAFEDWFQKVTESHTGVGHEFDKGLMNAMLEGLPEHCLSERRSFPFVRFFGWGAIVVEAVAAYIMFTLLCLVPAKQHSF